MSERDVPDRPDPYVGPTREYFPDPIPVAVMVKREREGRTLCALTDSVRCFSRAEQVRIPIPIGYVTDWASIPAIAQIRIQPFGRHAWAALAHDWLYAIGEPGRRGFADKLFLEKMEEADVAPLRRTVMYRAVQLGGGGGYVKAAEWWGESFRDAKTGHKLPPPFPREKAFFGEEFGPRPWTPT